MTEINALDKLAEELEAMEARFTNEVIPDIERSNAMLKANIKLWKQRNHHHGGDNDRLYTHQ